LGGLMPWHGKSVDGNQLMAAGQRIVEDGELGMLLI